MDNNESPFLTSSKPIEIIEGDNLDDIEMKLLDEEIKQNNEECFKKNIIETSCCQNNCLMPKEPF